MKQSIFTILLLLTGAVLPSYGDESISIKLNNKDHARDTVSLSSFANIFIEFQHSNDGQQYKVSIKLENLSNDNKVLCLFNSSYREKELRKNSIYYDRLYPGNKGKRATEACEGLSQCYKLSPSEEAPDIIVLPVNSTSLIECRLPIYIAQNKTWLWKQRTVLIEKRVIKLNIEVNLEPDEEYVRLLQATDSLINEIKGQTFCSNKNHQGIPLKKKKEIYTQSIKDLKDEILHVRDSLYKVRDYRYADKEYTQFATICERLDSINIDNLVVKSCDNDRRIKAAHSCKYCSYSIEDIYKKLESYYIILHNDPQKKAQIINDVEALYTCAQKNSKRKAGSYMARITRYYNRIKSK